MKYAKSAAAVLLGTLVLAPAFGKDPKGPSNPEPVYSVANVVSIAGIVTDIRDVPAGNPLPGWHVTLKSNKDTFDAYLAPVKFLKLLRASYANGDHIKVTGSKVRVDNADVILTREVTKNAEIIRLRDEDGSPVWEDWGVPMP